MSANKQLIQASKKADIKAAKEAIAAGANDFNGALNVASDSGSSGVMLQHLLTKMNNSDYNKINPFKHVKIVQLLLNKGADDYQETINYAVMSNKMKLVKLLQKKGASFYCQNGLLIQSASTGNLRMVKFLVENGANSIPTATNEAIRNKHLDVLKFLLVEGPGIPEYLFTMTNNLQIIKLLIEKGSPIEKVQDIVELIATDETSRFLFSLKNNKWNNLLIKAVKEGNFEEVKTLIKKGANDFNEALMIAAKNNFPKIVKLLIKNGAKSTDYVLRQITNHGSNNSLINIAKILVENGNHDHYIVLNSAAKEGNFELVALLADNVKDINHIGCYSVYGTALSNAAKAGHINIVKMLIQKGANEKLRDGLGTTAADIAKENGHINIYNFLNNLSKKYKLPTRGKTNDKTKKH